MEKESEDLVVKMKSAKMNMSYKMHCVLIIKCVLELLSWN